MGFLMEWGIYVTTFVSYLMFKKLLLTNIYIFHI